MLMHIVQLFLTITMFFFAAKEQQLPIVRQ